MTSRVLNPVVLSEFCKISATPAAVTMSRNLPCGRQLNRIKRDLFGSSQPIETKQISDVLEKYQEQAIKKWGFDFRAGCPLTTNSQFIWERIGFQESSYVPEMYTLTRAAHVRPSEHEPAEMDLLMDERAERDHFVNVSIETDDELCYDSQDESLVVLKLPTSHSAITTSTPSVTLLKSVAQHHLRKRQPKITEYMKERKRLAQTPKKISPSKRVRTSSSGSNSSYNSISSHLNVVKRHR